MTNHEIAQKIIDTENISTKSFSNLHETHYGILFYDEDNPDSHDANHAVITKYNENIDFDGVMKEIKEFYLSKSLPPRIYSNLVSGQLDKLEEHSLGILNHGARILIYKINLY